MTPDSREARIEAEAVTDVEVASAAQAAVRAAYGDHPGDRGICYDAFIKGVRWEAARKARASNDSGAELCAVCELRRDREIHAPGYSCTFVPSGLYYPQPAPDRVSRILSTYQEDEVLCVIRDERQKGATGLGHEVATPMARIFKACGYYFDESIVRESGQRGAWALLPSLDAQIAQSREEIERGAFSTFTADELRQKGAVARIERTLDTLLAGVTGLREDWDRALIAAAKAWNREGE